MTEQESHTFMAGYGFVFQEKCRCGGVLQLKYFNQEKQRAVVIFPERNAFNVIQCLGTSFYNATKRLLHSYATNTHIKDVMDNL